MHGVVETICAHITDRCNLKCLHCWSDATNRGELYISVEKLIRFLEKLMRSGLRHISISGGEASLHPDLCDLVRFCLRKDLCITMTTNGTIQPSLISHLIEGDIQPSKQMQLRVSIDGDGEDHDKLRGVGTYEIALKEVAKIKEWADWVGVNTVVSGSNCSIGKLCHDLSALHVDEWSFITITPRGRCKNIAFTKSQIISDANECKRKAEKHGFKGKLIVWDYLTHPRAGLLIDANEIALLPGITEEEDKVIGHIDFVTPEMLHEAVIDQLQKDPVGFFQVFNYR